MSWFSWDAYFVSLAIITAFVMTHKGVEGNVSRNGLTIFPWYFLILKLGRRFVIRWDKSAIALFVDTTRDHRMYRPADYDSPSIVCRHCGIHTLFWVKSGEFDYPQKNFPTGYCSGKIHEWRHDFKRK